ncbi:MAG: hypothetical protein ACI9HK_001046 [Pirellulaceae bacterium]|jgi:hypothetical protein
MTRTFTSTALFAALSLMLFTAPQQAAAQFNVLEEIAKQVKSNSANGTKALQNNSANALGKQTLRVNGNNVNGNKANGSKTLQAKPNGRFQFEIKPKAPATDLFQPNQPQLINEGKIDPNKFKPIKPIDLGNFFPGNGGGNNGGNGNNGNNNPPANNNGNGNNNNQQPDWKDIVDSVGDILHGNRGNQNGNQNGNHSNHNGHNGHNGHDQGLVDVIPNSTETYAVAPSVPRNPLPATSQSAISGGVIIVNPELNGGNVGFAVGSERFSLEPGFQQALPASSQRIIRFDRGGNFGLVRYSLTDGVYTFKVSDHGWDLVRKTYNIEIDNTANLNGFRYVVDGQLVVVPAGEVNSHKGRFPLVVGFDRGDGGDPAVMRLVRGTFQIRIDDTTGLWELADANQVEPVADQSSPPQLSEPALAENITP